MFPSCFGFAKVPENVRSSKVISAPSDTWRFMYILSGGAGTGSSLLRLSLGDAFGLFIGVSICFPHFSVLNDSNPRNMFSRKQVAVRLPPDPYKRAFLRLSAQVHVPDNERLTCANFFLTPRPRLCIDPAPSPSSFLLYITPPPPPPPPAQQWLLRPSVLFLFSFPSPPTRHFVHLTSSHR